MTEIFEDLTLHELVTIMEEIKARDEHVSVQYSPMPKQEEFHKSSSWCRLVFGGNRSGKSRAAAQEIYWWFTNTHPFQETPKKARIWCLSAEYRTLFEGIWTHLAAIVPPWELAKTGPKVPGWDLPTYIESKSGNRIDFISSHGNKDARKKVQAAEIDLLSVDEEVSGELWIELQFRLVSKAGKVVVSATLIESEDWLLDLESRGEQGDPRITIFRLDTKENKFNKQEVLDALMETLSEEEYEVRILGKSRKFSGLVYANFNSNIGEKTSHVIEPFEIPENYNRFFIFDPGARTAAGLWIAMDRSLRAYIYREMYLKNASLAEVVQYIRRKEGWVYEDSRWQLGPKTEVISSRLIDPHGFDRNADGSPSVGDRLSTDYDLQFIKGYNNKLTNIEDVRSMLMLRRIDEKPGLLVFKTCEKFLWERRRYRLKGDDGNRNKDEPRDTPIKRDDHLMNCIEYFASQKYSYNPYIISLTIEEAADLPDDEIEYPKENLREFKWRLRKARMMKQRQEALELDEY